MDAKELKLAYAIWRRNYLFESADQALTPYLGKEVEPFVPGQGSWLKRARNALLISMGNAGELAGTSRQGYARFEKAETTGNITMRKLAHLAEALDCELVYAIRPKSRMKFSEVIWSRLLKVAANDNMVKSPHQKRKGHALAAAAQRLMEDYGFRQSQGWTER